MSAADVAGNLDRQADMIASGLTQMCDDALVAHPIRDGADRFEFEEVDNPDAPWVLVRERDGARFQVDVEIFVRPLPALAEPEPALPPVDPNQTALPIEPATAAS